MVRHREEQAVVVVVVVAAAEEEVEEVGARMRWMEKDRVNTVGAVGAAAGPVGAGDNKYSYCSSLGWDLDTGLVDQEEEGEEGEEDIASKQEEGMAVVVVAAGAAEDVGAWAKVVKEETTRPWRTAEV